MLPKQEMCFEYYPLIPSDASSSAWGKICSNFLHSTAHSQAQVVVFLAHLWGAYAIPVALSGVRRSSSVVRRPSYVVCRLCPP